MVLIPQQTGASGIHPTLKEGTRPQQLQQAPIKNKPKSGVLLVNPLCPQSPSLTYIHMCLRTSTRSHLDMLPCTLNPSFLRFKGIVRRRWQRRWRVRYQTSGVTPKAGAFARPTLPPLRPNTHRTSHGPTSRGRIGRGWERAADQTNQAAR